MRSSRYTALLAFLLGSTLAASAADLRPASAYKAPPPAQVVPNWSGFNLGGGIGFRSAVNELRPTSLVVGGVPAAILTGPTSFNDTAFRAALFLGYDWQIAPSWIVGAEGDIAWADSEVTQPGILGAGGPADRSSSKLTWDASIRARVGYLITPSILGYVTGGVSWIDGEGSARCAGGAGSLCAAANGFSQGDTVVGWTIGAGFDVSVWQNWFMRAEYRYADYGKESRTSTLVIAPGVAAVGTGNQELTTHTALFGAYYKFRY